MSIAAAGCVTSEPDTGSADEVVVNDSRRAVVVDHYAEQVYASYQQAAHDLIQFEVTTLRSGQMPEIANRPVNEVLGVPDHWIRMQQRGTEILSVRSEARDASDEWHNPIDLNRS